MSANMKDAVVTTGSGGALFLPWWIDWLPHMWQASVSILAGVMLMLGVYSKILEIRQRHRDLEEPENDNQNEQEEDNCSKPLEQPE